MRLQKKLELSSKKQLGKLIVITGPSGAGKDSVIEGLREEKCQFGWAITTTSRPKRKGESEGKPYYFVSKKKFEGMIAEDAFLEWARVYENYYGNTKAEIEKQRIRNQVVMLKIDPQGARTVKRLYPESRIVFLRPARIENLKKRLQDRGTDSKEVIARRVLTAKEELSDTSYVDYIVYNRQNKLDEAVEEVAEILGCSNGKK